MTSTAATATGPWILVTGGCGYIGTHTIVVLLEHGYRVVVVDNLVNSTAKSLDRVAEILGWTTSEDEERQARLKFHQVDICDRVAFKIIFESYPTFQACIHFAGLKAVGESTQIPLRYYENNLGGTFALLGLMDEFKCHRLVFSSSATVYGLADVMPIAETAPVGAGITNAYGRAKYMIEEICCDFYQSKMLHPQKSASASAAPSDPEWSFVMLRYFNPVGSHPSGLIGEDPNGIPNNLMPYVAQVAIGRLDCLTVFGDDYDTPDGTGVRDYLHVMDLADGHLAALKYMEAKSSGFFTLNLGTGNGVSVLELVRAMSVACGHEIKYKIGPRRGGDIAVCYADPRKAKREMDWEAKRNLEEMCRDMWTWQSKNPNGFK